MRIIRIAVIAALWLVPSLAVAEMSTSLRALLVAYRCEVVKRLEQIYVTGDPASNRDRFIAVTVPGRSQAYVQCMFHDNQTRLYCEAASGFYFARKNEPRIIRQPPDNIAALGRLGFDTDDSKGNFNIDLPVTEPPDFNAAADFILRALHDGYGARGDMALRFNAPFAPKTPTTCVPMS